MARQSPLPHCAAPALEDNKMPRQELSTMIDAAHKAGHQLLADFQQARSTAQSPDETQAFLAKSDAAAATLLKEALISAHPAHGLLIEGSPEIAGSGQSRWIVDPLDGYANFARGLSHWATAIALEDQAEIVAAVIHDPLRQETFSATRGDGAWLNGETRLRVADGGALSNAMLATGMPGAASPRRPEAIAVLNVMLQSTAGLRQLGAAALDMAYVAADRLDGYWNRRLDIWHYAAGLLIVREAGGAVISVDGLSEDSFDNGLVAIRKPMSKDFIAAFQKGVAAHAS